MHHLGLSPPPVPRGLRTGVFLSVLGLVLGAVACAGPAPEAGSDGRAAAALDSVYATFAAAYDSANVQLLMDEVYHPDAFYLPPDSPILQGQDYFRGQFSFLERYARAGGPGPGIEFEIVDREIRSDLAYDVGTYTIRPPNAPDAEGTRGKFIVIWKRGQDGEWRIWADGFSSVVGPSARPERDGS